MPVLINEVIAEVENSVTEFAEAEPASQQLPMADAESALAQTLALIQQRQSRLTID